MEIYIDSVNYGDIAEWIPFGVVDGVTTNPGLMSSEEVYDIEEMAKRLADLVYPKPVSIEVTTNNLDEMYDQAVIFSSWGSNIVVKIPQETKDGVLCYGVINELQGGGVIVNATVAFSLGQVILSAKAGASYISIFAGRISDEGGDPFKLIRESVDWLERWKYRSKIITGSIRTVGDILNAAKAGSHIITIPPKLLYKMADHKFARATVREFSLKADKIQEYLDTKGEK